MMILPKHRRARGFTLVELLLYIGISSLILLAVSGFLALSVSFRIRNEAVANVEQEGLAVAQAVTQIIRNAEEITLPAVGAVDTSLVIVGASSSKTFDVVDGTLRMTEGAGTPVPLTDGAVQISAFTAEHLAPGSVRIRFIMSSVNRTSLDEFDVSRNFLFTATKRMPSLTP